MARDTELDISGEVVALLMEKIVSDKYPSVTMLDMIEQLANTEERSSPSPRCSWTRSTRPGTRASPCCNGSWRWAETSGATHTRRRALTLP